MTRSQCCCLILLYAHVVGLDSVSEYAGFTISGCLGDSIKILGNISLSSYDTFVSIYKMSSNNMLIATWRKHKTVPTKRKGQNDRLYLDKNGNIWFHNLRISDEATYNIQINIGNWSKNHEVSLIILVAPTKKCIPQIMHTENILSAHLKVEECGKPVASVYWLEHSSISISREIIQLQPRKDRGIYHACIEGEALKCAKISNLSDYCTFFNESYIQSESVDMRALVYMAGNIGMICWSCLGIASTCYMFIFMKKGAKEIRRHFEYKKKAYSKLSRKVIANINREKATSAMCRICFINPPSVTFMPCRHHLACYKCAENVTKCPGCNAVIKSTVKGYSMIQTL